MVDTETNNPSDETQPVTTSSVVIGYIRLCIVKKRKKLTEDQIKYLLPEEEPCTNRRLLKLLGVCTKSVMLNNAETVKLVTDEWADNLCDINNVIIPSRKGQIQYNMLMRHWLVEDGNISWDRVIMCIAFTTQLITNLLKHNTDPFRILDISRWCADFLNSKMGHFIDSKGWESLFEKESDWLNKIHFDVSFVKNPRRQGAFTQKSVSQSSNKQAETTTSLDKNPHLPSSDPVNGTQACKESQTTSSIQGDKMDVMQLQMKEFQQLTLNFVANQEQKVKSLEEQLQQVTEQVAQLHRQHLVLQQKLSQQPPPQNDSSKPDSIQYVLTPIPANTQLNNNSSTYPVLIDQQSRQQNQQLIIGSNISAGNILHPYLINNLSLSQVPNLQILNQSDPDSISKKAF